MNPTVAAHLFVAPYTAVVAVLAAVVETTPDEWLPENVRHWIVWLCVLACAPVAALTGQDMVSALGGGAAGLSGSWLLVELVEGKRRRDRRRGTVVRTMNAHENEPQFERPPTPKPDHDDQPRPDDDPPPLLPPPPLK
jgi:hypothetical protein